MPNGPTHLERLQREYTTEYKAKLDKYRHARIMHAFITGDAFILTANPYWQDALGYKPEDILLHNLYSLIPNREQLTHCMMQVMVGTVSEEIMLITNADGHIVNIMCWFSSLVERSSGAWVSNFTAVLRDV